MDWFFAGLWDVITSSWIDIGSLFGGLGYGWLQCSRNPGRHYISKDTGLAILHGIALFPLAVLVLASFVTPIRTAVLHAHGIILAGAAIVALFAMLENTSEE